MSSKSKIPCLDQGFVELVDHMGDDRSICRTARVSTGSSNKNDDDDQRLIDYLMRHRHTSPFEFVNFVFHVKAPIFVIRQWFRHRTAAYNEMSGRYRELPEEYYLPHIWRGQDTQNKQGSLNVIPYEANLYPHDDEPLNTAEDLSWLEYHNRLEHGVSKEMARTCLPLSTYSEFFIKVDLHNLLHFLKLRLDPHAQPEIQVYAKAMLDLIEPVVPWTIASWRNHVLDAITLSSDEVELLFTFLAEGFIELDKNQLPASRAKELEKKLEKVLEDYSALPDELSFNIIASNLSKEEQPTCSLLSLTKYELQTVLDKLLCLLFLTCELSKETQTLHYFVNWDKEHDAQTLAEIVELLSEYGVI